MDRVTYLILAGENNHHGGISSNEQKDFPGYHSAAKTIGRNHRPNTTQQKRITLSFIPLQHWQTLHTEHNPPKENQKSNNSTSKVEGQKSPNPRGNQPKDREGKKKVPTTILLFQRLRIFLYKWEPNAQTVQPTRSNLDWFMAQPNLFAICFKAGAQLPVLLRAYSGHSGSLRLLLPRVRRVCVGVR